jgi:hypothetical protein
MSNRDNHRRGDSRRSEHGPRYESKDPGKGSNSSGVAKGRRRWKKQLKREGRRKEKIVTREELEALSQEDLDEAVHEAKAAEAAEINNEGREAQIKYLHHDKMEVVVIEVDGTWRRVPFPTELEGWQALVGGMIEEVHTRIEGKQAILLVNEEGLLKQMKPNDGASILAGRQLVGPAVLLVDDTFIRWTCEC